MKGTLDQCIQFIQQSKEKSILLRKGDKFVATKLRSAHGDDATADEIIGVFTKHTPAEVILYEAGS